jgi:hypothetical protein
MAPTTTPIRPSTIPADDRVPVIDDDLLLRFQGRWVALTDLQEPVARHLLDNLGTMVPTAELRAAYAAAGGSADREAVRSLMHRMGRRLKAIGATVTFARHGGGMMVTVPAPGPDARP